MKASQDKKFVCEEADKALTTMVNSVAPLLLLRKLKAYVRHSNPRVRAKAAVSTSNCVSKMVFCIIFEKCFIIVLELLLLIFCLCIRR